MARVVYDSGELDSHHQILGAISRTLRQSNRGRARTSLLAVESIEVIDDEGQTVDTDRSGKIAYICDRLNCTHELVNGEEIVFTAPRT